MASSNLLSCLAQLEEKFDVLLEQDEEEDGVTSTEGTKVLVAILQAACGIVRDADQASPDFKTVVDSVDRLINRAVNFAYNEGDLCDFMPSYAHYEAYPLLDDTIEERGGEPVISHYERDMLKSLLAFMTKNAGNSFNVNAAAGLPMLKSGEPWSKSMKPHPLTSRLSRFRSDNTTSATSGDTLANTIYQARCEITSESIFAPINLTISSNGTVLLANGMGGYKNRAPALSYYILEDQDDFPDGHSVKSDLSDIAYWTTTDEERKLVFAADRDRIKSYSWGPPSGANYRRGLPTHTMKSGDCEGPLAILAGGRLVRAGKGSVAVWNLDTLPTHGAKGKTLIGNGIDVEDTWRDDPEDIEMSSGCPTDTTIKLELNDLAAAVWHPHPSIVGNMIIASDTRVTSSYTCISVDLEHGGKTAMKYLGHGASVDAIVTSPADPNVFMSGCDDGFARLFDVRHPLPALTLTSGNPDGGCPDVVLVHPDGIPTAFTGSDHNESIRLWDLRAQRIVYELSTGNNAVAGLAWDAAHSSLYAVTECRYMDRLGGNHNYRKARIVPGQRQGEDEDEDDDDDAYDERCWPERAYHGEDFFGYMFDAGDHRIYRYAFKENPDTGILPCYGQATTRSGSYW